MKKLFLLTSFLLTFTFYGQNPDFNVAPNGITCLCPSANFGDTGTLIINGQTKTFTKRSRAQLNTLIDNDVQDPQIALTCTSGIDDMNSLFSGFLVNTTFNQNLEHWDVSLVTDMSNMFVFQSTFNQALNSWDVSNVTNMFQMLASANNFNQPLNSWDVSSVTNMRNMFSLASSFNQPLDNWDVSNVTNMNGVFYNSSFNLPLNSWNVSGVTNMTSMFGNTPFNQDISNWDVSSVTNMVNMFAGASFNQPLDSWDVSQVTEIGFMFQNATLFNQPLDSWDVSNVTFMDNMFNNASSFNQDISMWCVDQIPNEPSEFALNSALQSNFFPNWGANCNLSTANPEAIGFNILIYPNPSNSKVFIENDGQIILSKIKLIDILGRDIKNLSASQITNGLDVSGVDAGNYFVQFTTVDNQQFVKRLIVK
jgi:surface protein